MQLQPHSNRLKPEDIFGLLQEIYHEENLEDALKILTQRGLDLFNSTMAGIWLFQEKKFHSLTISARNEKQEKFLTHNDLPSDLRNFVEGGIEGNAFVALKMTLHEIDESGNERNLADSCDCYCFSAWSEALREFGVRRILCVPLVHFGQLFGLLTLFSDDPTSFDEESVYWLEQLMPLISSNVYEQQLRLAALEREQALSLLLRGTEILVKAVSEVQLLAEAGEMAMGILYLEAGFFHMEMDGEWKLRAPFGRLKQFEAVWQEWIQKDKQVNYPLGYVPNLKPALRILEENDQKDSAYPVKKILIQPIETYRGVVGELWLMDSGTSDLEQSQEILSAFVRMLSMALETIRQRRELEDLAMTDRLTGILNRQGFEQRIRGEMASTLRRGSTFLFLILDLDGFKNLNDTQGHPIGDLALRHVAQNLQKSVRQEDIVARTGGDEFTVILTDLKSGPDALIVMERLKNNLGLEKYGLGLSIGVAEFPTESKDYETLYKVSDHRLYIGKQNGKGHIVMGNTYAAE
ncbi:sensor domain-containing diguanylate cyclase [Desulfosporosinus metallidurans]|uniref:Sensory box/GGDEF family protein n=1 Tax=Desulfosporosinus metallidurans TaxID=1888891 RepID=A0A1Q8QW21_9FIRM|nr:sensor domain-containing diguanylate cyclase [Desulfosporosinus metallidurans]OLN31506.1 Sensory box/GGDEF family protein [Desulfosporosinus metallidurans]